jgi:hypothetical protein
MLTPDVTTGINIGEVGAERAGTFSSAFVLPITRDGRALLTEEKRGNLWAPQAAETHALHDDPRAAR